MASIGYVPSLTISVQHTYGSDPFCKQLVFLKTSAVVCSKSSWGLAACGYLCQVLGKSIGHVGVAER